MVSFEAIQGCAGSQLEAIRGRDLNMVSFEVIHGQDLNLRPFKAVTSILVLAHCVKIQLLIKKLIANFHLHRTKILNRF